MFLFMSIIDVYLEEVVVFTNPRYMSLVCFVCCFA